MAIVNDTHSKTDVMKSFRPITKSMIQKLKDCREKELKGDGEPCKMDDMNYAVAPLYKRGLIGTKQVTINNKVLLGVYVTEAGINFLSQIMEEK